MGKRGCENLVSSWLMIATARNATECSVLLWRQWWLRHFHSFNRPLKFSCRALAKPCCRCRLSCNPFGVSAGQWYTPSASTVSPGRRLSIKPQSRKIFQSFQRPGMNGPLIQHKSPVKMHIPSSYLNAGPLYLWDHHFASQGSGSRILQSTPSTVSNALFPTSFFNLLLNGICARQEIRKERSCWRYGTFFKGYLPHKVQGRQGPLGWSKPTFERFSHRNLQRDN
jgi:hypothetical protein